MKRFEFQVKERFHRRRLDEFLFDVFRDYSKAYIRSVLKDNHCQLNGEDTNGGRIVRTNDFVEIEIDTERAKAMTPVPTSLDVVYEDSELLVVNKPAGILVHPTHRERDGTLLNGVTHYVNEKTRTPDFVRPLPVHRIDRETSGVVVFALNPRASRIITKQLRDRKVSKKYLALVGGKVAPAAGTINKPITRDAARKFHVVDPEGMDSLTEYKSIEKRGKRTLLEVVPVTGRTNQIRVHFADAGFPVVGDKLYGGEAHERLCLHALSLGLRHPGTNSEILFEAKSFTF